MLRCFSWDVLLLETSFIVFGPGHGTLVVGLALAGIDYPCSLSLVVQFYFQIVRTLQTQDSERAFVFRRQFGVFTHWRCVVSQQDPLLWSKLVWLGLGVKLHFSSLSGDLDVLAC